VSSTNGEHDRPEQEREPEDSGAGQSGVARKITSNVEKFDAFQREHKAVGIPVAVLRKFIDDQSTNLASMIAFWAFFSIFPLLLVFVTLLGFLVPTRLKGQVLMKVAGFLPLLNTGAVGTLSGQWWTLIVGIVSALWSGSAVVRIVQLAFSSVWETPHKDRPGLGEQLRRSVLVLATLGLGLVVSTVISSFVTGAAGLIGPLATVGGYVMAIVLDIGLFIAAFRMLTDREVTTRDVLPGALLSGLVFWVLQQLSSLIISRYLQKAQGTYGSFATVITLLWWFYLQGVVTMLGAQLNVVLKEGLHPRALVNVQDAAVDHRSDQTYAAERTYQDNERGRADFPKD
jgi:YihY family inner membrane protein